MSECSDRVRGCGVPVGLRPWSVSWPGYTPVDITPPELCGAGLSGSVAEGWAEPYATPGEVPDWSARRAGALVPFAFDEHGWPLNPAGRTGKTGRNLGRWGENQAADPIVVARTSAGWRVLLIQRGDTGEWALPGGMVDPGETAPAALVRELAEETSVDLTALTPTILARTYVADPRNSDHAWVCSTVALFRGSQRVSIHAGDDAVDATWVSVSEPETALAARGERFYPAHRSLLALARNHLAV